MLTVQILPLTVAHPAQLLRGCLKINSLIYMTVNLASSRFLAGQAGWKPVLQEIFIKNQ